MYYVYVFLLVISGAQVRLANVSCTRTLLRLSLYDMMAVLLSAFRIRGALPFSGSDFSRTVHCL